jgi:trimethyllysine dioxygenase
MSASSAFDTHDELPATQHRGQIEVESAVVEERHLAVRWTDGTSTVYPWIWLRDHAHDVDTMHPVTQQRQLFTAALDPHLRASTAEVVGTDLVVTWQGSEVPSILPVAFLAQHRVARRARVGVVHERQSWDADSIRPTPSIGFDEVMSSDAGVARWLGLVARYGFAIVSGTPPTTADTEALIRRVGYVRETIFGGFWEFTADLAKADTAYTTLELRPHTDGTYSHDAPGLQMLHCLEFVGEGGESSIVDGFRIAAELRSSAPHHYRTLSTVEIPGQYVGDGSHLMAARAVFRHDESGELVQVSFNNYDRAPFLLDPDETEALYDAIRAFEILANDPRLQWRHVLAPGEALLFDNWRVLHGRAAYSGRRRLCGAYLNHEDFESRLRLAASAT